MRVSQLTGKRTNSLGWAKSDCHACASRRRHCDRRRPRCGPCLAEGAVCSGYVQELNWERGAAKKGKPKGRRRAKEPASSPEGLAVSDASSQLPKPDTFVFVDHKDVQKRQRRRSRTQSISTEIINSDSDPVEEISSTSSSSEGSSSPASSHWSYQASNTSSSNELVLSPRVRFNVSDVELALSCFHSCFAYTTITYDVKVNPWNACLPSIHEDVPCARYAAIALAQRQQGHLQQKPEGTSILRLKSKALSLFASKLEDLSFEGGLSTALLLIALDYAESGVSNWIIHLQGAYRILESHGGIALAESRPNVRAQLAMLLWYDVSAALLSRCGPVFPRSYVQALMEWQDDREWSMLALNGLPDGMFLDMHELAQTAALRKNTDFENVDAVIDRISAVKILPGVDRHQASMCHVWKLFLLLYCARVFPRSSRLSPAVEETVESHHEDTNPHSLGMKILGIVAEIPDDSNYQKQCLLPIIVAACEISAASLPYRKIALRYAEVWKERSGMWVFKSCLQFMGGVWARNDTHSVGGEVDDTSQQWVPWTEVYLPSAGHGFLLA